MPRFHAVEAELHVTSEACKHWKVQMTGVSNHWRLAIGSWAPPTIRFPLITSQEAMPRKLLKLLFRENSLHPCVCYFGFATWVGANNVVKSSIIHQIKEIRLHTRFTIYMRTLKHQALVRGGVGATNGAFVFKLLCWLQRSIARFLLIGHSSNIEQHEVLSDVFRLTTVTRRDRRS